MKIIYIVTGSYGCYSDWDYWIEKAFVDEEAAKQYAAWANSIIFKCLQIRGRAFTRLIAKYKPGEIIHGHSQLDNKTRTRLDAVIRKHLKWGRPSSSHVDEPSFEVEAVELT